MSGDLNEENILTNLSSISTKKNKPQRKHNDQQSLSLSRSTMRLIPPRDIRRCYPEMFINVFNSLDSQVFGDFYQTYFNLNTSFIRSCPLPTGLIPVK
jgi:hypothetical protein